jgi:fermentation-respiration switch protein FrsA (DUF1100 family)
MSIFKDCDIRGIYNKELHDADAYSIGRGLCAMLPPNAVMRVGGDVRLSTPALKDQLIQGLVDGGVPVENTLLYSMALSREKIPFSAHIFPNGAHGLATVDSRTVPKAMADPQAAQWIALAKLWIKELLGI